MRVSHATWTRLVIAGLALALLLGAFMASSMWQDATGAQDGTSTAPVPEGQSGATGPDTGSGTQSARAVGVQAVATGLNTPWALAFAPDGRLFFTERPGRVRVVEDGVLLEEPLITLPAEETSEGGVMGLAVDPGFPEEPYLYAMYSYRSGEGVQNRVVRLRVAGNSATEDSVLLDGIPGANNHNGGRVKVGPDGLLYVTTGDAQRSELSQDPESLAGKILRIDLDGSIPEGNPFPGSPVYSLGHRNPQGLDWHPETGLIYATEHGPSGNDEVNLIEPGENYGWPEVQGEGHGEYSAPLVVYSPSIAPAGAAFYRGDIEEWDGSLFFGTLRGTHLHRLELDPDDPGRVVENERLYEGEYGRLRDVVMGPDGALYVTTSNRDGRGSPDQRDDRILRIGSADDRAPVP